MSRRCLNHIDDLIDKPTWLVRDLIKDQDFEITQDTVNKIVKLSGIEAPTHTESQKLQTALKQQMAMIRQLYEDDDPTTTDPLFRLIETDHQPATPLTLAMIEEQVANLKPDEAKGEVGFDITHLKQDLRYFTVKTN